MNEAPLMFAELSSETCTPPPSRFAVLSVNRTESASVQRTPLPRIRIAPPEPRYPVARFRAKSTSDISTISPSFRPSCGRDRERLLARDSERAPHLHEDSPAAQVSGLVLHEEGVRDGKRGRILREDGASASAGDVSPERHVRVDDERDTGP